MRAHPIRILAAGLLSALGLVGASATSAPAQVAAPDGRIAFQSSEDGDCDIWTMNPDGSDLRNLTSEGETGDGWSDVQPSWSPDGSQLAFVSNRFGSTDLFVMAADGSDITRITVNGEEDSDFGPDWSPDGSQIVFAGQRPSETIGDTDDFDIYVIDADGSNETNITDAFESQLGQFPWNDKDPDWSPVDDRIVFSSARAVEDTATDGAYWRIVTADPDGSNQTVVSDPEDPGNDPFPDENPNHDEMPEFSPDGEWIAFGTHQQPEQQWDVQIVRSNGTGQQNVLPAEEWEDLYPTWSSDGTEILFTSNRTGDHTRAVYAVDVTSFLGGGTSPLAGVERGAPPLIQEIGGVGQVQSPDVFGDRCTVEGTPADEHLEGTPGRDVICARGGDDVIDALGGDDVLLGGQGDDVLLAGLGRDILEGGAGLDTASYRDADGITVLLIEDRASGQGIDRLRRVEHVRGSSRADVLIGNSSDNRLWGLGGADELLGLRGRDVLVGGSGRDDLDGGGGIDSCTESDPSRLRRCEKTGLARISAPG